MEFYFSAKFCFAQPVVWSLIETVGLPYVNSRLSKGLPLPIIQGFNLQNAETVFSDSRVVVCSDVTYTDAITHNESTYRFQQTHIGFHGVPLRQSLHSL